MKKIILLSLLLFCMAASASKIKLESVNIDKAHSNAWTLTGQIRNLEKTAIKGSVKIKLLNAKGDIVKSFRAYVNDGDPIAPEQAGPFKYTARPSAFSGVKKTSVIFVDSNGNW